ncbi:MAG: hypothetical protein ACT4PE_09780 [Candidatus Eiseniibacteriota bacterium]
MRLPVAGALLLGALITGVGPSFAAPAREDVVWARFASAPITLDGVLNESSWAKAESVNVRYGIDAGIPGSGYKVEAGLFVGTDSTDTTLKFLVHGNQLYLGATVRDSSVGGSELFNRFDGFLMAIKDHADTTFPKPPAEYFYSWWYETTPDPQVPGQAPSFIGKWATSPPGSPRDSTQIANWDAVTVVQGLSNDDSVIDQGYTVEMRFNLTPMGYDVTQPGGDIVEWNIQIYDCDWFWPFGAGLKFHTDRVWFQSPWGNVGWYHEVKIHARPDVTVNSGMVPIVGAELVIPEVTDPPPTINGSLADAIWSNPDVYTFDIRWDDAALRASYPGDGPFRSGQFQPPLNMATAFVADPADATVKMTFIGDWLYMAFDVSDRVVQFHPSFDRWDGFLITLTDRVVRGALDHQLLTHRLSFRVSQAGAADAQDELPSYVVSGDALVALALKSGTTVDTLGTVPDQGYTAELALDLTGFGYPSGLGDGSLFLGVNHLDGDSFIPTTDSYGTRTWWFRQYEGECCPVWAYLAPTTAIGVDPFAADAAAGAYAFARPFSSPSTLPGVEYSLPEPSQVLLDFFDVGGRLVDSRALGVQGPGVRQVLFDGRGRAAGVYLYRVRLADPQTGTVRATLSGKTVLVK